MVELEKLKGIGPKTIPKLIKLKINTPLDLVYHFPRDYLDFTHTTTIQDAPIEENISLTLKISDFKNIFTPTKKNLQIAQAFDSTGQIQLVWLNQPFLTKIIKAGKLVSVAGQITFYKNKKTIFFPKIGDTKLKKIFPIYPQTKGLSSNQLNNLITKNLHTIIPQIKDPLPISIQQKYQLISTPLSLQKVHQPQNTTDIALSQHRLSVDELLSIHLNSLILKHKWQSLTTTHSLKTDKIINSKIKQLIASLPYKLTSDQQKVWRQVKSDLISDNVANRLIQGDVGSGKTIIALLACYLAYLNSKLSILIAPTQILATQHYQNFKTLLPKVPIKLITSSTKSTKITKTNQIIIATHAVFYRQQKLKDKVSLVIIDEQHKFGVDQRSALLSSPNPPHSLTMTATPIPRSIKLTLLGNLNVSSIHTMPTTRLKPTTFLVPSQKQSSCYQWLYQQLKLNHSQAFVVCPFIDDSDKNDQVVSAQAEFTHLQKLFPDLSIGLLHGQTKNKDKIINDFIQQKITILVSTPIIEVGIDIPNANYMIVNSADRFGLSQLHQLRGRIGRGDKPSFCCFFTSSQNPKTLKRLEFIKNSYDCFKIAKFDLENRGPGTIFSTLQHGFPQLKLANLSNTDQNKLVRSIAKDIISDYPKLVDQIIKTSPTFLPAQN